MIFLRPEHEFLRLVAMAAPDWPALVALAPQLEDWGYLRGLAEAHQLGGVLSARLLAGELDGLCQAEVRRDCTERQAALRQQQAGWFRESQGDAISRLEAARVRYVVFRGGHTEAFYGLGEDWARARNHLDILTHPDDYAGACAVAEGMGRDPSVRGWSAPWQAVGVLGARWFVNLFTVPPGWEFVDASCLWDRRMHDGASRGELVGGLAGTVPEPSRHFAALASETLVSLAWNEEALTLAKLARLYNLTQRPGFDWRAVWSHLRVGEDSLGYSEWRRLRPGLAAGDRERISHYDEALRAAGTIGLLARVYPIPSEQAARAEGLVARCDPHLVAFDPRYYADPHGQGNPVRGGPMHYLRLRLGPAASVEELVFGTQTALEARLERGVFEPVERYTEALRVPHRFAHAVNAAG